MKKQPCFSSRHSQASLLLLANRHHNPSIQNIIAIVMLLGWMGERNREAQVKLVQEAAAARYM